MPLGQIIGSASFTVIGELTPSTTEMVLGVNMTLGSPCALAVRGPHITKRNKLSRVKNFMVTLLSGRHQ
jgi:hypothetical protein